MSGFLLLIGLAVAACVLLIVLPVGRPAVIGIAVAAAALALVLRSAGGAGGGFGGLLGILWGGSVALAALAQGLCWRADAAGRRARYPLIAGLVGAGAVVPPLLPTGAM